MWFRRRPRVPIFVWFLALLGLGSLVGRKRWGGVSEEGRESYRRKRHAFLQKLDDAYRVWDEPDEDTSDSDEE
jgi:hypothetical protein